jgi:hypothetical protein
MLGNVTMETKVCSLPQLNSATDRVFLNETRKLSDLDPSRTSCFQLRIDLFKNTHKCLFRFNFSGLISNVVRLFCGCAGSAVQLPVISTSVTERPSPTGTAAKYPHCYFLISSGFWYQIPQASNKRSECDVWQ